MTGQEPNSRRMRDEQVWLRAVLLAAWVGAANLWLQRHFGIGFGDPISVLGLTEGPAVFFMVLDRVLSGEEKGGLKGIVAEDRIGRGN